MPMKTARVGAGAAALTLLVAAVAWSGQTQSSCLPWHERQRLERLIGKVAQRSDATFIRNGRSYDAATAARFLRGKWRNRDAEVCSAEDFIVKVASGSSTTGQPYLVRLRDGREIPAAVFFQEELAKLT